MLAEPKIGKNRGNAGKGRPRGALNKRTAEAAAAVAATGMTPLEYLTSIYQDVKADEARRIDAAKAAAPYVHPKRAPVDSDGKDSALTVIVNKGA